MRQGEWRDSPVLGMFCMGTSMLPSMPLLASMTDPAPLLAYPFDVGILVGEPGTIEQEPADA